MKHTMGCVELRRAPIPSLAVSGHAETVGWHMLIPAPKTYVAPDQHVFLDGGWTLTEFGTLGGQERTATDFNNLKRES